MEIRAGIIGGILCFMQLPLSALAESPQEYLTTQVTRVIQSIDNFTERKIASPDPALKVQAKATRNSWLKILYSHNIIDHSDISELLMDKYLAYEVFKHYLAGDEERFFLKTIGLKNFLQKNHLIDTNRSVSSEPHKVTSLLKSSFPEGFVLRPAVSFLSPSAELDITAKDYEVVQTLTNSGRSFYLQQEFSTPYVPKLISQIASGERYVLQESLETHFANDEIERNILRVHTYSGRVVKGATVPIHHGSHRTLKRRKAEKFVQSFLDRLPGKLQSRQAWGVDVVQTPSGELKITEIFTNQGRTKSWSRHVTLPSVVGAYTRHFERFHSIQFSGFSGFLFRNSLANYPKYLRKVILEGRHI